MAFFWTKLQIPGRISSKHKRTLFFWKRFDKDKSRSDAPSSRLPDRPQPCNPECPSRCLQIKNCDDKESAMRKLSNCRDIEINEEPKSYWETLFGWRPEVAKNQPDARDCRNAYCAKRAAIAEDPRLRDSRYESTPGDVFIFTEGPRIKVCETREPLPKPPPSYKLPKAVVTRMMTEEAGKSPQNCAAALDFVECRESPRCSGPKASTLPYEELRPPDKRRKLFSCRQGVTSEDVARPIRSDGNSCESCGPPAATTTKNTSVDRKSMKICDSESNSTNSDARGNSRVEQLKKLTRAKDCGNCFELFTGNIDGKEGSQCRRSEN